MIESFFFFFKWSKAGTFGRVHLSMDNQMYQFCLQTESELQDLIREVEENPAPADAPEPPAPKPDDDKGK